MPANTLAGVNIDRISQLSLDALITEAAPLRAFHTDFSADVKPAGETVTTRFASGVSMASVQDMKLSKAPKAVTTVKRTITLDQYDGVVFGFQDLERTYTDRDLVELFVAPAVSALVEHVTNELLKVATIANGFTTVLDVDDIDFGADQMADLAKSLTEKKVLRSGRRALLPPSYYGNLAKDNVIQAVDSSGSSEALREHRVARVSGIDLTEYNGTIPDNGESMKGIVGHRSALCLAARGIAAPPPGTWWGKVRDIVEPVSGLPLQLREYYDGTELVYEWNINFGVSHGIGDAAIRIVDTD